MFTGVAISFCSSMMAAVCFQASTSIRPTLTPSRYVLSAILKLKELVDAGELGDLHYVYSNRLNLGRVRKEENILWSFAPHDVAIVLRLVDAMPIQVSATGGNYVTANIADVSVSHLLFDTGARAHIFVSWLHPFKEQRLVVVGDRRKYVTALMTLDPAKLELAADEAGTTSKSTSRFCSHPKSRTSRSRSRPSGSTPSTSATPPGS